MAFSSKQAVSVQSQPKTQNTNRLLRGLRKLGDNIRSHPLLYLMAIPVVAYYIIYHYMPMYGVIIAWQDYVPSLGIAESDWVGWKNFESFLTDPYFFRTLRNTVLISVYQLIFAFPFPILFALLLNEVRSNKFRRVTQTVTYMPHFISVVVICGLMLDFTKQNGLLTSIICSFTGMEPVNLLSKVEMFRPLYVGMNIWQEFGWNSIIYLAAITGINPDLYEAATMDGAGKIVRFWKITLPCIRPVISVSVLLELIWQFNNFNISYMVTQGGPLGLTKLLSVEVYQQAFTNFRYGYASSISVIMMLIALVPAVIYIRSSMKEIQ